MTYVKHTHTISDIYLTSKLNRTHYECMDAQEVGGYSRFRLERRKRQRVKQRRTL